MEFLRTMFRVIVMSAALVIGYQAWQHYGPPAAQLKSLALRVLEIAKSSIEPTDAGSESPSLSADPRPTGSPLIIPSPAVGAVGPVVPATALEAASAAPAAAPFAPPALAPAPAPTPLSAATVEPPADKRVAAPADNNWVNEADLLPLYSRLEELGARQPRLATWGSDGRLYRFLCQASPTGAPELHRQFEAIAAEPGAAVAEVVAKVEAWRKTQQETAQVGGGPIR